MQNKKHEKFTLDNFIRRAKSIHGDKYDYSEVEIHNCMDKVKIFCKKHKKYFIQRAYKHLYSTGCLECISDKKREKATLTQEVFLKKAKIIHGDKYDYSKAQCNGGHKAKIIIICKKHGEFLQYPTDHLTGRGCPKCAIEDNHDKSKLSFEKFVERAKYIYGNKYSYCKDSYESFSSSTIIFCKKCNRFFTKRVSVFLNGKGCPFCNKAISYGEKQIIIWLENHNIKFEFQKRFKDCKDKAYLPFDFYLPAYNICIEYQGKQHYLSNTIFDKYKNDFENRKRRDEIKRKYCKQHKINLIEIKYTENIQKRLEKDIMNTLSS